MKLKYIIGILVCLISLTGTALAADPIVLNVDNEGGAAVAMQHVVASVSGNVVTFSVSPKEMSPGLYYPRGWFDTVGLPEGAIVASEGAVKDKYGNDITKYKVDSSDSIGGGFRDEEGIKIIFSTATLPNPGKNQDLYTTIYVTFSGTFKDPVTPYFGAHVAWGEEVNGIDSAKFLNGDSGSTEIPEFPTVALPVAAIMGIMFIFGRRKQE